MYSVFKNVPPIIWDNSVKIDSRLTIFGTQNFVGCLRCIGQRRHVMYTACLGWLSSFLVANEEPCFEVAAYFEEQADIRKCKYLVRDARGRIRRYLVTEECYGWNTRSSTCDWLADTALDSYCYKKPSCCRGTARARCQLKSGKILHKCSTDCTWKGLQPRNDLQGHSRSLTLVPFDRPHMISY